MQLCRVMRRNSADSKNTFKYPLKFSRQLDGKINLPMKNTFTWNLTVLTQKCCCSISWELQSSFVSLIFFSYLEIWADHHFSCWTMFSILAEPLWCYDLYSAEGNRRKRKITVAVNVEMIFQNSFFFFPLQIISTKLMVEGGERCHFISAYWTCH